MDSSTETQTNGVHHFTAASELEMSDVAKAILKASKDKRVILLYGEMGVGKTTLVKSFCKLLGSKDKVTSPTFSIVNQYESEVHGTIYHADFYRLESTKEAMDSGIEEHLATGCFFFVEWPEKVPNLFLGDEVRITIQNKDNIRVLEVIV